jgi:hypothetical protein
LEREQQRQQEASAAQNDDNDVSEDGMVEPLEDEVEEIELADTREEAARGDENV